MKVLIPSYHRSDRQKTLEWLKSIGYPKDQIYIFVQAEEDIAGYQKYKKDCNVLFMPATNVAENRNNSLSILHDGEKALMLDDNVTRISVYRNEKFEAVKSYADFKRIIDDAFQYCAKNNATVFCTNQIKNELYLVSKCKKNLYARNRIGGWLFGITKSEIEFDERLRTKEDFDFLLAHMARGENVFVANWICATKTSGAVGGCHEVHNSEVEAQTSSILKQKYPSKIEFADNAKENIRIAETSCPTGYSSPRWTGEIADCSLPLTLDTYSNCSFGCVYCFSQYQRGVGEGKENYLAKRVSSISVDSVKKLFALEKPNSEFYEYIKNRRTIQYGGLSDQFDGFERKYGKTYELLKYLREINYPICFSTKSAWVFHDPKYRELFKGADNWNMKFSIITLDEDDARKIEVGVPTPRERLEAMRQYNMLSKGGTTLRLRPFIIGVSDKTYLDLIRAAADDGATAVTTEFFCLEMRSINVAREHYRAISERCGFDIVDFYRKYSESSGYLRLNRKIKEPYIKKMQELCHELGLRFYVSDAHFKECSDSCCCCGLDTSWDYSRGHYAAALQIAKKKGFVRWRDIEQDMEHLHFDATKGTCKLARDSSERRAQNDGMTMKDYFRYIWNNPKRGQSPYKIFGKVLIPDGYDEDRNIIYKYNDSVTFQPHGNEHSCDGRHV